MNILLTSLTYSEALPMLEPQLSLELDCPPLPDIQIATTQYISPQTGSAPPQPGLPADVIVFGILIVLTGISRLIPLIYQAKNE